MFDLEKLINDIAKFQKVRVKDAFHDWAEVKAKNVKKKKKEITIRELEVECEDALNKLIEKDKRELKQGGK